MSYKAPTQEILATMRHVAGLDALISDGVAANLDLDLATQIVEEGGRFAAEVIAPLNRDGDKIGPKCVDGVVTTAPGWKAAYAAYVEGGWNGLSGPEDFGGQGMPALLQAAATEMWNSAAGAFAIGPLLTHGAVEAVHAHASDDLKARYLEKMVSGEWMGTMNLTEPQAGSDLAALRSKAERAGDGTYRIFGQKIFITYGEHDLTDNIVHLVLARLPDAPAGTRGISLFLVPKFLPDGTRNDVLCAGIEHKMGLHGSPTCTMVYGDKGGAIGWLVGEENKGLACMFTMMNSARLAVGLQGVAVAERAYQQALNFAWERKQGRAGSYSGQGMGPIALHPDVQRNLMTMRALTQGARAICYMNAAAIDRAHNSVDEVDRAAGSLRAGLLTPVAKGFSTDIGVEVASIGVQVHGGMGYIEETGAAQHLRDSRIYPIYEGTNGIQAIDLVTRKIPAAGGSSVRGFIGELQMGALAASAEPRLGNAGRQMTQAVDALAQATEFLLGCNSADTQLAGATPYARLFGLATASVALARKAMGSGDAGDIATARFFSENLLPVAAGLADSVINGGESVALPPDMMLG